MITNLTYDDVLLVPQYSDIESRSQINIGSYLDRKRDLWFKIPVISAPMDTVTGSEMAVELGLLGMLAIVHRYNTIDTQYGIASYVFDHLNDNRRTGFAIGITGDYLERAKTLIGAGARILCLDVAHGDHIMMKNAIHKLRETLGDDVHLMAGNVATVEGARHLADWGADSIRVGVGGGCFVEGTQVMTIDGPKPIEKVSIGDKVITHKNRIREVTNTFTHDLKFEVIAINGIKATPNHEFYVLHKDKISIVTDDNIHDHAEWISADMLTKEYVLIKAQ
jgi:IMP dehydrogenase/GMP reductase